MGKSKHVIAVSVLTVISTAVLYAFFSFVLFRRPLAASAEAGPIDTMFGAHFFTMALLFSLIMVIMLYSVVVFRREPGDDEDGPHIHGHTGLEVLWTIVPTVVVIGFGIYGAIVLNDITSAKENEMPVHVEAQQWAWSFAYPDYEDVPSAELILPVNQPVVLQMESIDVLHSFWVPEFRVKQDLVPGRTTELRFTPTETGDFKVRCAEICGLEHANMVAPVRVVSQQEFDQFIAEAQDVPDFGELTAAERGEIWYGSERGFGCVGCHSLDGSPGAGPSWQGLWMRDEELTDGTTVTADEEYIRSSILNPNEQIVVGFQPNVMPQNFAERFAEREQEILQSQGVEVNIMDDLIAFIQTLE